MALTEKELRYLKKVLCRWRRKLATSEEDAIVIIREIIQEHPDPESLGIAGTQIEVEVERNDLINEIDCALQRINDGTYGYCQKSGKPISFRKLKACPIIRYNGAGN